MFAFETLVSTPPQAQRVSAAFYRCLDRLGDGGEGEASLHVRQELAGQRIIVRLWSAQALAAFQQELRGASA